MNEQLQKLYEQSFVTDTYVNVGPDGATLGIRFDPEKFAELIVRECILTIQMGITRDGTKTEKFIRSMTHIKDIKEHFGVEE